MKRARVVGLLIGALLSVHLIAVASAATPNVGQHLHLAVLNQPNEDTPISHGLYTFHIVAKEHNNAGATTYLRIDRDGGTTTDKIALHLGPCADCTATFDWTISFSGWSAGRHEMRWHLEEPDTGAPNGHKRQFTTSRVQVCVQTCSPSYRSGQWLGGGSWYGAYAVPIITTARDAIVPGATITARSQYADLRACAFVDEPGNPIDFHGGSSGRSLGCWTGTGNHSLSLAGTANGDNLVVLAIGPSGQQAGVVHVRIGDTGPTYYFETQSWWAQAGLVLP